MSKKLLEIGCCIGILIVLWVCVCQKSGKLGLQEAQLPESEWQTDVSFPKWREPMEENLTVNDRISFDYYDDQGILYVSPDENVTGFSMYVNDVAVDTGKIVGGKTYALDFSKIAKNGKNTVQITRVIPYEKEGKVRLCVPYPVIQSGTPKEEGISADTLELIDEIVSLDIENGFPGAQMAVIRHGKLVYENAWGTTNAYLPDGSVNPKASPVTTDTLYDLASVTKMAVGNMILQKLVTDGKIRIEDKISDYLGVDFYQKVLDFQYADSEPYSLETQWEWKKNLRIRDVLSHQAGFPPSPRYFNSNVDAPTQEYGLAYDNLLYCGNGGDEQTKESTWEGICKTPLMYEPGTKTQYSDVDYMLLGFLIEKVVGTDLDTYFKETFAEPLGLTHMTYNPLQHGFRKEDCAATELCGNTRDHAIYFEGIREDTVQGETHDENAYYSMGGVSGHAGLFSNATDLAKLFHLMLLGGEGEHRYFSKDVIETFTAPKNVEEAKWGLGGWREGEFGRVKYFGINSGNNAFGHQGWTGTFVMVDPQRDLVIAFLTNKINTPVADKEENPDVFRGSAYTTATLGFAPQILSIGMDAECDVEQQLNDLVAQMAIESFDLIPEGAMPDNAYYDNAKSKIRLLEKRVQDHKAKDYEDLVMELKNKLPEKELPEKELPEKETS